MGDPEYSLIVRITTLSDDCTSGWVVPKQCVLGVQEATQAAFLNCNEEMEHVPWQTG